MPKKNVTLTTAEKQLLTKARKVLDVEVRGLKALTARLDETFIKAVQIILECQGRIVITGMGKSGHIGRKLAATLASTGTPALFLHPAEGVHGDLGAVVEGDVLIALSYGGNTEEITAILPAIKRLGVPIIAFCGRRNSELVRHADALLDISVEKEACPFNLAPTASTTAMLALGDALAVVVMQMRKFKQEDYQKLHPAGRLGRMMLLTVGEIMRTGDAVATVMEETRVQDVLFSITEARAGCANIINKNNKLLGIITDGDIRRHLLSNPQGLQSTVKEATSHKREGMTKKAKTLAPDQLATEALLVMEKYQISDMPVVDKKGKPVGVLYLKDLLRAGIV